MAQATFSCPFGAIHLEDRRGTPQRRTSFANDGLPPDPIYGGRVPERWRSISGAQNLSGGLNSRRATGPWVCKNYGDCDFIPAPGPVEQVLGCRARPPGRAAYICGRPVSGPYEKDGMASRYTVGAAHWAARPGGCRAAERKWAAKLPRPKRKTLTKPLPALRGPARLPSCPPGG